MKIFSFYIIVLILIGCKTDTSKEELNPVIEVLPILDEKEEEDLTMKKFKELISTIEKGFSSFSPSSVDLSKLTKIDTSFLNKYLIQLEVNSLPQWNIYHDKYEPFFLYEWNEGQENKYFTMIQKDESCCTTSYLCICDNNFLPIKIFSLSCDGGDGGWSMYSYTELNSKLSYMVYSMELFEDWELDTNQVVFSTYKNDSSVILIDFSNSEIIIDTLFKQITDTIVFDQG